MTTGTYSSMHSCMLTYNVPVKLMLINCMSIIMLMLLYVPATLHGEQDVM